MSVTSITSFGTQGASELVNVAASIEAIHKAIKVKQVHTALFPSGTYNAGTHEITFPSLAAMTTDGLSTTDNDLVLLAVPGLTTSNGLWKVDAASNRLYRPLEPALNSPLPEGTQIVLAGDDKRYWRSYTEVNGVDGDTQEWKESRIVPFNGYWILGSLTDPLNPDSRYIHETNGNFTQTLTPADFRYASPQRDWIQFRKTGSGILTLNGATFHYENGATSTTLDLRNDDEVQLLRRNDANGFDVITLSGQVQAKHPIQAVFDDLSGTLPVGFPVGNLIVQNTATAHPSWGALPIGVTDGDILYWNGTALSIADTVADKSIFTAEIRDWQSLKVQEWNYRNDRPAGFRWELEVSGSPYITPPTDGLLQPYLRYFGGSAPLRPSPKWINGEWTHIVNHTNANVPFDVVGSWAGAQYIINGRIETPVTTYVLPPDHEARLIRQGNDIWINTFRTASAKWPYLQDVWPTAIAPQKYQSTKYLSTVNQPGTTTGDTFTFTTIPTAILSLVVGDPVWLIGQTNQVQNGAYLVQDPAAGILVRTHPTHFVGETVYKNSEVYDQSTDKNYRLTADAVIDTDNQVWQEVLPPSTPVFLDVQLKTDLTLPTGTERVIPLNQENLALEITFDSTNHLFRPGKNGVFPVDLAVDLVPNLIDDFGWDSVVLQYSAETATPTNWTDLSTFWTYKASQFFKQTTQLISLKKDWAYRFVLRSATLSSIETISSNRTKLVVNHIEESSLSNLNIVLPTQYVSHIITSQSGDIFDYDVTVLVSNAGILPSRITVTVHDIDLDPNLESPLTGNTITSGFTLGSTIAVPISGIDTIDGVRPRNLKFKIWTDINTVLQPQISNIISTQSTGDLHDYTLTVRTSSVGNIPTSLKVSIHDNDLDPTYLSPLAQSIVTTGLALGSAHSITFNSIDTIDGVRPRNLVFRAEST